MSIQELKQMLHWNYFLTLESDVDVVAKQLCPIVNGSSSATNIEQYRTVLRPCLPEMENSIVTIPRYDLDLQPWCTWRDDETPDWWRAHKMVKHQRGEHFALANLENVLNAMAGLFLLVLYYYRGVIDGRRIEPPPNLFTPPAELALICPTMGGRMALFFNEEKH